MTGCSVQSGSPAPHKDYSIPNAHIGVMGSIRPVVFQSSACDVCHRLYRCAELIVSVGSSGILLPEKTQGFWLVLFLVRRAGFLTSHGMIEPLVVYEAGVCLSCRDKD